jgi:hypothetical protein
MVRGYCIAINAVDRLRLVFAACTTERRVEGSLAEPIWAAVIDTAPLGRTHDRTRTRRQLFCKHALEPNGPSTHGWRAGACPRAGLWPDPWAHHDGGGKARESTISAVGITQLSVISATPQVRRCTASAREPRPFWPVGQWPDGSRAASARSLPDRADRRVATASAASLASSSPIAVRPRRYETSAQVIVTVRYI